jgi:tRNA-dihydrouridine synthase
VVRESQATLYTIGIFDENDPDRNPEVLRQLARISGGEAFFPQDLQEVPGICKQIAQDIRHRYTIGFVPARPDGKGSLRNLKVAVAGSAKNLTVHARTK